MKRRLRDRSFELNRISGECNASADALANLGLVLELGISFSDVPPFTCDF